MGDHGWRRRCLTVWMISAAVAVALGCEQEDPVPTDGGAHDAAADGGARADGNLRTDGSLDAAASDGAPADGAGPDGGRTCMPLATDYSVGATDMWPACVSDDGDYHRIEDSISSIARVMSFESIAALLFDPTEDPSPSDFTNARMIYQEAEGLDSRVVRRYDPHFNVPDGTNCGDLGTPAAFPDYCVGPARLQPMILDALNAGIAGSPSPSRVQAAKAEAGLLWFLYVSMFKESLTCTTTARDCDSAYAYYTGGEPARGGIGLASRIRAVDPAAHDRVWDGILAMRCWRDLDAGDTATDTAMRDRARNQMDHAALDGIAGVVRARLMAMAASSGDTASAHHAFVTTLGPLLLREATARSPSDAAVLTAAFDSATPEVLDAAATTAAIDRVFDCP